LGMAVDSKTTYDVRIMTMRSRISSFIGTIAGCLLSVFGKAPPGATSDDLSRAEFKTSTQRMGVSFGERIRNVFRFKWIKRASKR
jgi:hypothetical protein